LQASLSTCARVVAGEALTVAFLPFIFTVKDRDMLSLGSVSRIEVDRNISIFLWERERIGIGGRSLKERAVVM
jgi:hypothetical protein